MAEGTNPGIGITAPITIPAGSIGNIGTEAVTTEEVGTGIMTAMARGKVIIGTTIMREAVVIGKGTTTEGIIRYY